MKKQATPKHRRSGHIKKSYSMPKALYGRMRDAMHVRGLENESAFVTTAISQLLAEQQPATPAAA